VQSFDLNDHHFVYAVSDTLNTGSSASTGFFEEVYGGNIQVLIKWSKSIQSTSTQTTLETFFSTSSKRTYIKKGNVFYSVGSESAVLKALKDKKKELQQYIKANKIKFKADPNKAMYMIAAQYDKLSR
jgi:hypothetical protein